jgi:hypothetical protein
MGVRPPLEIKMPGVIVVAVLAVIIGIAICIGVRAKSLPNDGLSDEYLREQERIADSHESDKDQS